MQKINLYTLKGTKTSEVNLPKEFDIKPNMNLLAQANYVYEDRSHSGLRSTKTRSEINKTTKKVYKQKGTGGARHGSRRANLFVGGGVIFGPRAIRKVLHLSKALKVKAKYYAYAFKFKAKEIVAVSGLSKVNKTSTIYSFINALTKETKIKRFTFILSDDSVNIVKFLRNIKSIKSVLYRNANVLDIIDGGLIVMDEAIFEVKKEEKPEVKKTVKKAVKKETK